MVSFGGDGMGYFMPLSLSRGPTPQLLGQEEGRALRGGMVAGEGTSATSPFGKVGLWGSALPPTGHGKGGRIRSRETAPENPPGLTSEGTPGRED